MAQIFDYAQNPDILLRIQGILPHFVSVLQFLVQLFWPNHFQVQTYVWSIYYLECPMVFLKVFLSIRQNFHRIVFQ